MKVNTDKSTFNPITLNFTIETREEFEAIHYFMARNSSIPDAFRGMTVNENWVAIIKKMMTDVHVELDKQ